MCCSFPNLLYRLIPESSRWLLSKDRVQEATAVVLKVVKFKTLTLPPDTDGKEGGEADGKRKREEGVEEKQEEKKGEKKKEEESKAEKE